MLDTAIVGAGVCGLALARSLEAAGHDYMLFEARARVGGRVLSRRCEQTGALFDLGPTWYWPDTQPTMAALVEELGLDSFAQPSAGALLVLRDPDKAPEQSAAEHVHGSARRLGAGMGGLVDGLARGVPTERLRLAHVLESVTAEPDHVVLHFTTKDGPLDVAARRVVLALPPRLVAERLTLTPALAAPLRSTLAQTSTWMAAQAKAVLTTGSPSWRSAGLSGSAFVTHERAVLSEVFDASDPHGGGALGGFVALSPEQRAQFRAGLPMLIGNQAAQLFGAAVEGASLHYQDWAAEPLTASTRDREEEPSHEDASHPALRAIHWGGRLFFGSSETASYAPGYLEGALDAARRLKRDVLFVAALAAPAGTPAREPVDNGPSLAKFGRWAKGVAELAFGGYRERLTRALAQQETEQLTQRALLGAVEAAYRDALALLEELPFDGRGLPIAAGRSALTPAVQDALGDFHPELIDHVVRFNGSSCALSNFREDHELPGSYLRAIERDIAAAYREFCLAANAILVAKRG